VHRQRVKELVGYEDGGDGAGDGVKHVVPGHLGTPSRHLAATS
jgi:hypothetical protein